MLKLLKNLKDNWISVVIIVLLLCLQAWTDLRLPDYTSKIVNVGIQAGGIENIAPTVIRKSTMDTILLFTKDDEEILSKYSLISKKNLSKEDYNKLKEKYPLLEKEDLYEIKKLSKSEKEELDKIITKPFMAVYFINNEEYAGKIKEKMLENATEEQTTAHLKTKGEKPWKQQSQS